MILISLCWQLQSELACSSEALSKASVVDVQYFSHLQVYLVKNSVLHVGAVAAPKTRKEYAFLAIRSLYRVEKIFSFS